MHQDEIEYYEAMAEEMEKKKEESKRSIIQKLNRNEEVTKEDIEEFKNSCFVNFTTKEDLENKKDKYGFTNLYCKKCNNVFSKDRFADQCPECGHIQTNPIKEGYEIELNWDEEKMNNAEIKINGLGPKQIDGKARFDLIPPQCLFELAKVYNIGCGIKYPKKSWEKGLVWGEVYGQIHRHANSWMGGESYDPEDGLHHLAHVAWACFTLMHYEWNNLGEDDRTLRIDKSYKKIFSKEDYEKITSESDS